MPKYNQPRKIWQYSNEFKVKAVQLSLLADVQIKDVASTLDIPTCMLSRWRKEYREDKIVARGKDKLTGLGKEQKELDRLKKLEQENARLKKENDLLKKWQRYLAEQHQNALDSSSDSEKSQVSDTCVIGWGSRVVATTTGASDSPVKGCSKISSSWRIYELLMLAAERPTVVLESIWICRVEESLWGGTGSPGSCAKMAFGVVS